MEPNGGKRNEKAFEAPNVTTVVGRPWRILGEGSTKKPPAAKRTAFVCADGESLTYLAKPPEQPIGASANHNGYKSGTGNRTGGASPAESRRGILTRLFASVT